jgi:PKD repeat protein
MYCRKCGLFIPDDSKFCPHCGAETVPKTESEKQPPNFPDTFMFDTGRPEQPQPSPEPLVQKEASSPGIPPTSRSFLPYSQKEIIIWVALALIGAGAVAWWPIGWSVASPFLWLTAGLLILAGLFEGVGRRVFGAFAFLCSMGLLAGIILSASAVNSTYWGNVVYYGWEVETPFLGVALIGTLLLLVFSVRRVLGKRGHLLGRFFGGSSAPAAEPPLQPPAKLIVISAVSLALIAIFIGYPLYSYLTVPALPIEGETLSSGGLGTPGYTALPTTPLPTSPPVTSTPVRTTATTTQPEQLTRPDARFSASTFSGYAPLTVYFRDDSTGSPQVWLWDFGDESSASVQNPVHTYSNPGAYSVRLSVTGPGGTSSSYPQLVQVNGPIQSTVVDAAFSATPGGGLVPLTVTFIDMSSGSPVSWAWAFGDGETSNLQNPVHVYTNPGYYTVRLTVRSNSGETSTAVAPAPIIAGAPITTVVTPTTTISPTMTFVSGASSPVADFTYTPDSGPIPLTVSFQDQSTGSPTNWYWDFGDGDTSTLKNPIHTFREVGDYYTLLMVTNNAGESMTERGPISVFYID